MTREEAIFCEKSYIGETNCTDCKYYGTETCQSRESHKMAIKALEQEPIDYKTQYENYLKKSEVVISQLRADRDRLQDVYDKIRAEIERKIEHERFARSVFRGEEKDIVKAEQCTGSIMAYNNVIKLIDKYKVESEE